MRAMYMQSLTIKQGVRIRAAFIAEATQLCRRVVLLSRLDSRRALVLCAACRHGSRTHPSGQPQCQCRRAMEGNADVVCFHPPGCGLQHILCAAPTIG